MFNEGLAGRKRVPGSQDSFHDVGKIAVSSPPFARKGAKNYVSCYVARENKQIHRVFRAFTTVFSNFSDAI